MSTISTSAICCFCGNALAVDEAVLLAVYPAPDREESQELYAHRLCLSSRLHSTVPWHPDLFSDEV
jgi:hypothetical protein